MPRIATYVKRRMTGRKKVRTRAKRPKSFKSEEAAKKYAESKNLKNYKLVYMPNSKNKQKTKIVQE